MEEEADSTTERWCRAGQQNTGRQKVFVNGFAAFIHCHRGQDWQSHVQEWGAMTDVQKAPYKKMSLDSLGERKAQRKTRCEEATLMDPADTPWGLGDQYYPLRPEHIENLDPQRRGHEAWSAYVNTPNDSCAEVHHTKPSTLWKRVGGRPVLQRPHPCRAKPI